MSQSENRMLIDVSERDAVDHMAKPRSTDDGVDAVAVGGLGRRAAAVIVVTSMRAA